MRIPLRSISHDDTLSAVGHLDELRSRIIVSLLALGLAFGLCFWQNHRLLHLIDRPLAHQTQRQVRDGQGPLGATYRVQQSTRDVAVQLGTVVDALVAGHQDPAIQRSLMRVQGSLRRDVARLSAPPQGNRPVTLGIGEPLSTTLTVTLLFALILSLPVLLWQAYGFVIPALDRHQRRLIRPLLLSVPGLFAAGVAFGYLVVLPAAVRFLENFNSDQFNVLVQASQYYKFAATTLLAMGLLFQVPAGILAITRTGAITPRQLRRGRRYAVAACAAVAALLPGDALTMLLETVPLYLLFEAGVLLAAVSERRRARRAGAGADHGFGGVASGPGGLAGHTSTTARGA
jgi:sec-independent protein translocase protein TatC